MHLHVGYNHLRGWPELKLASQYHLENLKKMAGFEIRPQVFEYLLRVAEGSLPSSFSRQCHQEVRHFAMMLRQVLQRILRSTGPTLDSLRILSLDADALVKESSIKVTAS